MKNIELKLVSELLKNSRRSDRELAKVIGASQPTITRIRHKLEKNGVIKEYTAIPDFLKLGYEILALTFVKLRKGLSPEETEKARQTAREEICKVEFSIAMLERGIGMGHDGVFLSYHEDYGSYLKFLNWLKQFSFVELANIDSFLISLPDEVHYAPLTFSALANHVLKMERDNKKKKT